MTWTRVQTPPGGRIMQRAQTTMNLLDEVKPVGRVAPTPADSVLLEADLVPLCVDLDGTLI